MEERVQKLEKKVEIIKNLLEELIFFFKEHNDSYTSGGYSGGHYGIPLYPNNQEALKTYEEGDRLGKLKDFINNVSEDIFRIHKEIKAKKAKEFKVFKEKLKEKERILEIENERQQIMEKVKIQEERIKNSEYALKKEKERLDILKNQLKDN